MKLEDLLETKIIYENVRIVNLDVKTKEGRPNSYAEALRVFNRPVEKKDFKCFNCNLDDCLSKNVVAIFAADCKHKLYIQVSKNNN